MTVATYKWTIDRYHQAVEAGVFDDRPVELLKGELVVMAPEGEPHTYFSDRPYLTPKGYQTELILAEGAIAPIAFPDVQIEVKRMFCM